MALTMMQKKMAKVRAAKKPAAKKKPVAKKKAKRGKGAATTDELCRQGIASRRDANKWVLKNHPDKGGNAETFKAVYPAIQKANRDKKYCTADVRAKRRAEKDAIVEKGRAKFLSQPFGQKESAVVRLRKKIFGRGMHGGRRGHVLQAVGMPAAPGAGGGEVGGVPMTPLF